jgi:hypothetical protein
MGTNYFVKKRMTDAQKADMQSVFNEFLDGNFRASRKLKEAIDEMETEIHIGKSSYGWQFLWDHNNCKYYQPTMASITKFVTEKCGGIVIDEYGAKFTWEEFLTQKLGHAKIYGSPEHHDADTYEKWVLDAPIDGFSVTEDSKNMARSYFEQPLYDVEIGGKLYKTRGHDFQSRDGLRVSVHTDFS